MTTSLAGVDVSHWQTAIDWAQADKQLGFAMLKCSQGTAGEDPTYPARIAELRTAGERRGSYHFPAGADPAAEAAHYVATAGRRDGEMQALDFEGAVLSVADPVGWAAAWLGKVIEATDNIPLIYMSASTVTRFDWTRVIALNVGLWVASWSSKPASVGQWPFWVMWQRTDHGVLAGTPGAVDLDVFNGSAEIWAKYADNRTDTTVPAPAPAAPAKPAAPQPPTPPPAHVAPAPIVYTVREGDTLSSIAAAHGTTWRQLVAWNAAKYPELTGNPNLIRIGWQLTVGHTAAAEPARAPAPRAVVVQRGDTLSGIAAANHTTIAALIAENRGRYPTIASNPNLIQPGWVLTL